MPPGAEPELRIRRGKRAYHPPFHAKGVAVDGLRRSPGSRVRMFCIRIRQAAFPGFFLVAGCGVLAYSCAAARELHPLPSLCREAKTRSPKDWERAKELWKEFSGGRAWKSNGSPRGV